MRDEPRSGCAINAAVEALGDQWSLIVLRDVIFGGRRHFRELLTHSTEGIASNILSSRLKALVVGGLLTQEEAGRGRRATYSLTEAGIQTVPLMVALGSWGMRHRPTSHELTVRARLLEEGGPSFQEDLMDELREVHLGIPRPHPDRPLASTALRAAYERALAEAPDHQGTPSA
ncbi:winged helix-turn-helix transcriptional regulator [Streptomyces avicenniae]|uniref:winged helix-turn-helix transcriptional regulator n=1 Tax=Streptomyces avicenniae TaxID=500153 RepID=UPI00069B2967|nr:helix-turn-helix domain-containing protein [Streptomyces avicenniae]